ncbi:hypothetical protein RRG08_032065 [Elysia crispata]|uniref:Uncharacterized protein n=1 Tax=Elysia crispata TaxID=231223 RepID=A0AAE0ZGM8_9GAST|nr:hypothetical protein RRG08_032065 [Elysia crispata]
MSARELYRLMSGSSMELKTNGFVGFSNHGFSSPEVHKAAHAAIVSGHATRRGEGIVCCSGKQNTPIKGRHCRKKVVVYLNFSPRNRSSVPRERWCELLSQELRERAYEKEREQTDRPTDRQTNRHEGKRDKRGSKRSSPLPLPPSIFC